MKIARNLIIAFSLLVAVWITACFICRYYDTRPVTQRPIEICKYICGGSESDTRPSCLPPETSRYETDIDVLNFSNNQIAALLDKGEGVIIKPPTEEVIGWSNVELMSVYNNLDIELAISNSAIKYYFFLEGNYYKFGSLPIRSHSGTKEAPKYIIAIKQIGSSENPEYKIIKNDYCNDFDEVIVYTMNFQNSSNWVINGITFRQEGLNDRTSEISQFQGNRAREFEEPNSSGTALVFNACSDNNIVNNCLFENQTSQCISISTSDSIRVQRSVFRTLFTKKEELCCALTDGNIGILLTAQSPCDPNYIATGSNCDSFGKSSGNIFCSNRFYDLVDGIGLNYANTKTNIKTGTIPGTIIHNNIIYIDKLKQIEDNSGREYTWAENGIDIKNGASENENPIIVSKNIIWGYRPPPTSPNNLPNCGARGDAAAITIHNNAQNIVLDSNLIYDSSIGMYFNASPYTKNVGLLKNILVKDNIFSEIRQHPSELYSTITGHPIIISHFIHDITIENNKVFDSDKGIYRRKFCQIADNELKTDCEGNEATAWEGDEVTIRNNYFYNITELEDTCPIKFENPNNNQSCINISIEESGNICSNSEDCEFSICEGGLSEKGCAYIRAHGRNCQ